MILKRLHTITAEQVQKLIFYGLAALTLLLPVPHLFLPESEKAIGIQATFLMIALLYFGFLLMVECVNHRFSVIKSGVAVKCVICLSVVGVISIFFSEDKMISLYGTELRGEGLFTLMAYYMIFTITTLLQNKEYRKKLLYLFLLLGVLVVVLGLMQFTGLYVFGNKFPRMAYVPMRNPNFYGAFAVLFAGVAIGGFYVYDKSSELTSPYEWWNRITWYLLVLIGYTGCICSDSSLVYAGLIMMLVMYLFLEIVTKRRRFLSLLALVAGLIGLILLFDFKSNGAVTGEIKTVGAQIKSEGSVFGDSVGSSRMLIWKETVSLLPKYGWFGCGIELLGRTVSVEEGVGTRLNFDKAHNEYLNLWVTEGIFALLFYLVFLFALFIPGLVGFFKKKVPAGSEVHEELSKIALFAFFGYIAQAFFNISVVQVAPYFWMICGLLYRGKRSIDEEAVDC